ncbi:ANTAR domain-containing protein [Actinokineospora sp. NBRC 105648]|uniref:ANTAR domain-containing protein n=1 Tax=Actinokineospora sp. NBRC 105648 TaxID=3032206 RepID=UPI0024A44A4D|nr:ANTAR domain-containing protein [Actinokineospora sp. NBRC 105648]GLZ37928.1 hypothetical protein Acsp05_15520 [Actinokineospora sp. NBRC 105648]
MLLELYATAVEALRSLSRYVQAHDLVVQLRGAVESRAVIDQAKGIIMGSLAISGDATFSCWRVVPA